MLPLHAHSLRSSVLVAGLSIPPPPIPHTRRQLSCSITFCITATRPDRVPYMPALSSKLPCAPVEERCVSSLGHCLSKFLGHANGHSVLPLRDPCSRACLVPSSVPHRRLQYRLHALRLTPPTRALTPMTPPQLDSRSSPLPSTLPELTHHNVMTHWAPDNMHL